jgi:hypothetical protein
MRVNCLPESSRQNETYNAEQAEYTVWDSEVAAGLQTFSHHISASLLSAFKARGFVLVFVAEWELFRKQESPSQPASTLRYDQSSAVFPIVEAKFVTI